MFIVNGESSESVNLSIKTSYVTWRTNVTYYNLLCVLFNKFLELSN